MLLFMCATTMGFLVVLSIASPLVGKDDSSSVKSISEPLVGRSSVGDTLNPQAQVTDALAQVAPMLVNPWTELPVRTDVPLGPPNLESRCTYPYSGRFTGDTPSFSCGDQPRPGNAYDPYYDDCAAANLKWDFMYFAWYGRQTQVYGTCVLAWVPAGFDQVGEDLQKGFTDLLKTCRVGLESGYVSNYAYASWDTTYRGTFSVYKNGQEPDTLPPAT